jgi:hypothetical protein
MNLKYMFEVEVFPQTSNAVCSAVQDTKTMRVTTTGSEENRARRRLLDALHDRKLFVKRVELLATETA